MFASLSASAGRSAWRERAIAAGWRSRKMKRASGQQARSRSAMKTLFGVLSTIIRLPLPASSRCSTRSHSRYSSPSASEPELAHGALGPLRVELHGHVAQVQLVRRVELRVAVEQHAQERRARAQRAEDERRPLQQPVAAAQLAHGAARCGAARPCAARRRGRRARAGSPWP